MKLIIISGRSGSGKSTALRALEDAGYHCIDNFPVALLRSLISEATVDPMLRQHDLAIGIDARSAGIAQLPEIRAALDRDEQVQCEIIYLNASSPTLVKRFSETRRRHPLTNGDTDLRQAIDAESRLLNDIAALADLTIDTTQLEGPTLAGLIKERVADERPAGLNLLFRSFGFKFGVPVDADLVFDVRCLPNPYWVEALRPLTGLDRPVQDFLAKDEVVCKMQSDIITFLDAWLPRFEANRRTYMTVALGCTGGQHRSVHMAEQLGAHFAQRYANVLVRHREVRSAPAAARTEQDSA